MNRSHAQITASESVEGMMKVMDDLTIQETGKFFTNEGAVLPW
jgi:hypothetical protein